MFCPLENGLPNLTKYPLARNSDGPGAPRRQPAPLSHKFTAVVGRVLGRVENRKLETCLESSAGEGWREAMGRQILILLILAHCEYGADNAAQAATSVLYVHPLHALADPSFQQESRAAAAARTHAGRLIRLRGGSNGHELFGASPPFELGGAASGSGNTTASALSLALV